MNITISVPDDIARNARHLAVDRGVSLSKYVSQLLEEQVGKTRGRHEARERMRRMMAEGLEFEGKLSERDWTRDDLHRR